MTPRAEDQIRDIAARLIEGLSKPQRRRALGLITGIIATGCVQASSIGRFEHARGTRGPMGRPTTAANHARNYRRFLSSGQDELDALLVRNAIRLHLERTEDADLVFHVDDTDVARPWATSKTAGMSNLIDASASGQPTGRKRLHTGHHVTGLSGLGYATRRRRSRRRLRRRRLTDDDRAARKPQRIPLAWRAYVHKAKKGAAAKEAFSFLIAELGRQLGSRPGLVLLDRGYRGTEWFRTMDRALEPAPNAHWAVLLGDEKGGRFLAMQVKDRVWKTARVNDLIDDVKCDKIFYLPHPRYPDKREIRVLVGFRKVHTIRNATRRNGKLSAPREPEERTLAIMKSKYLTCPMPFLMNGRVRTMAWARKLARSFLHRQMREDCMRGAKQLFGAERLRVWKHMASIQRSLLFCSLAHFVVSRLNLSLGLFRAKAIKAAGWFGPAPERDHTYRLAAGLRYLLLRGQYRGPNWRPVFRRQEPWVVDPWSVG